MESLLHCLSGADLVLETSQCGIELGVACVHGSAGLGDLGSREVLRPLQEEALILKRRNQSAKCRRRARRGARRRLGRRTRSGLIERGRGLLDLSSD